MTNKKDAQALRTRATEFLVELNKVFARIGQGEPDADQAREILLLADKAEFDFSEIRRLVAYDQTIEDSEEGRAKIRAAQP